MDRTVKRLAATIAAVMLVSSPNLVGADELIQPSPMSRMVETLNPVNWRMPQWKMPNFKRLMPAKDETVRIRKKKDSLFDEVAKTTSSSWKRTKQVFNPQKMNPARFFQASAKTKSRAPKRNKPGFFGSMFGSSPKPQSSGTVSDFLAQPKPNR